MRKSSEDLLALSDMEVMAHTKAAWQACKRAKNAASFLQNINSHNSLCDEFDKRLWQQIHGQKVIATIYATHLKTSKQIKVILLISFILKDVGSPMHLDTHENHHLPHEVQNRTLEESSVTNMDDIVTSTNSEMQNNQNLEREFLTQPSSPHQPRNNPPITKVIDLNF